MLYQNVYHAGQYVFKTFLEAQMVDYLNRSDSIKSGETFFVLEIYKGKHTKSFDRLKILTLNGVIGFVINWNISDRPIFEELC